MLIDCFLKVNVELFYRKMDAMKKKKVIHSAIKQK